MPYSKDKKWREFIKWQIEEIRKNEQNEYEIDLLCKNQENLQKIIFKAITYIQRRGNADDKDLLEILQGGDE